MANTYRYVRAKGVRQFVTENGKRCGSDFLDELNRHIYETICRCLNVWNGNKKTLDRSVVKHVTHK